MVTMCTIFCNKLELGIFLHSVFMCFYDLHKNTRRKRSSSVLCEIGKKFSHTVA